MNGIDCLEYDHETDMFFGVFFPKVPTTHFRQPGLKKRQTELAHYEVLCGDLLIDCGVWVPLKNTAVVAKRQVWLLQSDELFFAELLTGTQNGVVLEDQPFIRTSFWLPMRSSTIKARRSAVARLFRLTTSAAFRAEHMVNRN